MAAAHVLHVVLALVAFCLLATAVIYTAVGERPLVEVEAPSMIAREQIVRDDDSFNTVFVGSSIMFRQVNPDEFDADPALNGRLRSYNLGNPGLYPMRSISYLEHLVDNPPDGVEYILCELFRRVVRCGRTGAVTGNDGSGWRCPFGGRHPDVS